MPAPSYAKILCTTSSANTAIGTSAAHLFDTDLGSSVWDPDISDDITWDKSAGTITFANAGVYHVVTNLITETAAGNRTHTITFNLNSDSAIYTGAALVPAAFDPVAHTHQRIISVSAGDVLHVKGVANASTFGVNAGSTLVINRVTSNVYASSTVSTAGSNDTTDEFNPLDTDGDGPAFSTASKIASGITFTGDAGSMTVPSAGRYFIMINNLIGAQSGTNSDCTIHLKEGSDPASANELLTIATRSHANTDVEETTICVIEDLATDAVLTITYDMGSGGSFAAVGTTFTVYKLNEDVSKRNEALDVNSASITVVNKASSTASASEINPFDEDNYSSADFDTRYNKDITFTSGTGTFTINSKGTYWVFYSAQISTASDAKVTTKINIGGAVVLTGISHVDSLNDPMNRTYSAIVNCVTNDTLTVTIDSDSPNIQHLAGSSITIVRIPDWAILEKTSAELIDTDFTLNTYAPDVLHAQYNRHSDQVPFILGTPGPLSLRGRTVKVAAVSTGDRKN